MGWFQHAFHDIKHGIKTATSSVANTVVKPAIVATATVGGSVYDHVVKPVAHDTKKAAQFVVDEGYKFGKKGEELISAEADVMVNTQQSIATAVGGLGNFATNVETGVGGFLENSWSYLLIGGGVLAVFVLSRR